MLSPCAASLGLCYFEVVHPWIHGIIELHPWIHPATAIYTLAACSYASVVSWDFLVAYIHLTSIYGVSSYPSISTHAVCLLLYPSVDFWWLECIYEVSSYPSVYTRGMFVRKCGLLSFSGGLHPSTEYPAFCLYTQAACSPSADLLRVSLSGLASEYTAHRVTQAQHVSLFHLLLCPVGAVGSALYIVHF